MPAARVHRRSRFEAPVDAAAIRFTFDPQSMSNFSEEQARAYMHKLLAAMSEAGGSDLFIANDFPPSMKAHGNIRPLTSQKLTGPSRVSLRNSVMNERQREEFAREFECNFALAIPGPVALSRQRLHPAAACRHGRAHDRVRDAQLREARVARNPEGRRDEQARAGARRRRHRLGQVDVACGDDRPPQPDVRRSHHHDRGPGRIRARVAEVPRSRIARWASTRIPGITR